MDKILTIATIASLSVGILTSIIGSVIAILQYKKERDKRETAEKAYIEVKNQLDIIQLKVSQTVSQQVSAIWQPIITIINKPILTDEDNKTLEEKIPYAVAKTDSSIAIGLAAPLADSAALNILRAKAIKDVSPKLDKFLEDHPELLTSSQKEEKAKKAFQEWQKQKP